MQSEAYNSASPDAILLVQAIWPSQFLRKTLKLVKTFCFYTLGEKWSYRKILQQKHRLQYTSGTTKKYNFFSENARHSTSPPVVDGLKAPLLNRKDNRHN